MRRVIFISLLFFSLSLCATALAQTADSLVQQDSTTFLLEQQVKTTYEISGIVKDKQTGEVVPFATVFFPGSPIGTPADIDGNFKLNFTVPPGDSISVQALGYDQYFYKLDLTKEKQYVVLELSTGSTVMNEVVIIAGEDPAITLMTKAIRAKPKNNPDKVNNYKYEAYNKIEIDLINLSREEFEKLPVPYIKQLSFIYDNLDTSGKVDFLPFFLIENLSDYYYQRSPKREKEFIKANQIRGIKNESITQYTGKLHLAINPYDNYLSFFDKKYVSPLSDAGPGYYKYRIVDTVDIEGYDVIELTFTPLRKGENCFEGVIRIVDSVYALAYISADLPKEANLNWIKEAKFYKSYTPISDSLWFCVKENVTAELGVTPQLIKLPAAIVRKTTSYKHIQINQQAITDILHNPKYKTDVIVADTARNKDASFWAGARHEELNKNEQAIYNMFDTLEKSRTYTKFKNTIKFLATGVKEFGPIELGPYWSVFTTNVVEGNRFRFSMGTTPKLFKNIYLNGYVAYGTKDEKFKYNASALWLLNRKPRSYLFASHKNDIDYSMRYFDRLSYDNIFSLSIRKPNVPLKLLFTNETVFEYFKEYHFGLSHKISFTNKSYDPYDPLPSTQIFVDNGGNATGAIVKSEIDLQLRFSYKERFLEGNYYRMSLGSKYPDVTFHYTKGLKNFWNGGYDYSRVTLSVADWVEIAPLGALYFNVYGGKYFGTLPYLLLEVLPGNENFFYNRHAFNLIYQYEYLADQYLGLNLEHSIGGGIFTYIPYVKKLKLRQFWTAKSMIGSLSKENEALNLNKGFPFKTIDNGAYIEVGTGIENILRIFRVDFIWRLRPVPQPGLEARAKYFGVFGSVKVDF